MGLPCLRLSSWKSRRATPLRLGSASSRHLRHLRDVALHLHHVVEHEVRQHRDGDCARTRRVRVVQRVAPCFRA